jgi:hypothetical protein
MQINPRTGEPVWLFPFESLGDGESFFIPTLKPNDMVNVVMSRARAAGVKVRAYPTTHNQVLGVRVWRIF